MIPLVPLGDLTHRSSVKEVSPSAAPVIVLRQTKKVVPAHAHARSANRGWTHLITDLRDATRRINLTKGGHAGPTQAILWGSYDTDVSDDELEALWQWARETAADNMVPYPKLRKREPHRLSLDRREKEKRVNVPGLKSFQEQRHTTWHMPEFNTEQHPTLDTMLNTIFGKHTTESEDGVSVTGVMEQGRRNALPNAEVKSDWNRASPRHPVQDRRKTEALAMRNAEEKAPVKKRKKKGFRRNWHGAWTRLQGRLSRRLDQELCRIDQDRTETYVLKTQNIFRDRCATRSVTSYLTNHRRKAENMRQEGPRRIFLDQVRRYLKALEKLADSTRQLTAPEIFLSAAVCHCLNQGRLVSEQFWFRILNFLEDSDFALPVVVLLIYVFHKVFDIEEAKYVAYTDLRGVQRIKQPYIDFDSTDQTDECGDFDKRETYSKVLSFAFQNYFNTSTSSPVPYSDDRNQTLDVNEDRIPSTAAFPARPPRPPRPHAFIARRNPCYIDCTVELDEDPPYTEWFAPWQPRVTCATGLGAVSSRTPLRFARATEQDDVLKLAQRVERKKRAKMEVLDSIEEVSSPEVQNRYPT